ncbi:MAG: hypothetical protein E7513_02830 [Ruminococcaceae bacterium]|nr:hypothetical protein [Oscillospiraceae bacterium]
MLEKDRTAEIGYELCGMISAVLNGGDASFSENDLDVLFSLSCKHRVSALVSTVIDKDAKNYTQWSDAFNLSVIKKTFMDLEREQLLSFFKENDIWYVLLKGLVLQNLYPDPHLREMCDNDILYDANGYNLIKEYMRKNGYSIEHASKDVHVDEYEKKPYCFFELHKNLFNVNKGKLASYYRNITKKLVSVDKCEKRFTDEDFYVYMIAHSYKHFVDGGTGLRSFIDCYLYNKNVSYDKEYVNKELELLNIEEFEKEFSTLADKLFCGEKINLTETEREMFLYVLSSGAYGTLENHIGYQLENESKLRYICKRLFPPLEWYKGHAPFFYKHKWAIPFYSIYRIFDRVTKRRKYIEREIGFLKNTKK